MVVLSFRPHFIIYYPILIVSLDVTHTEYDTCVQPTCFRTTTALLSRSRKRGMKEMTTDARNSRENNVRDREKKAPTPFLLMSCCYCDLVGAVGFRSTMAVTMAVSGVCVCILSILFSSSLTAPQTDFRIYPQPPGSIPLMT